MNLVGETPTKDGETTSIRKMEDFRCTVAINSNVELSVATMLPNVMKLIKH